MSEDKDSVTFNMRIERALRDAFTAAASRNDRPAAQLVRDFMREYVAANAKRRARG
jgi:predicted HicB family RNase H-like nuclease